MKRTLTGVAALAAVVCFAAVGSAQVLERVYTPESIPYIGTTTDFGYGVAPVYRASNYAPVAAVPTTAYYAPATTSYYAPSVTTSYYAPAAVPTTAYYAPSYTSYYAPAYTSYYSPAVTTAYYAPTAAVVPYSSYYAPSVYYGRAYYYGPAPLVPGQPVRNAFRARTW